MDKTIKIQLDSMHQLSYKVGGCQLFINKAYVGKRCCLTQQDIQEIKGLVKKTEQIKSVDVDRVGNVISILTKDGETRSYKAVGSALSDFGEGMDVGIKYTLLKLYANEMSSNGARWPYVDEFSMEKFLALARVTQQFSYWMLEDWLDNQRIPVDHVVKHDLMTRTETYIKTHTEEMMMAMMGLVRVGCHHYSVFDVLREGESLMRYDEESVNRAWDIIEAVKDGAQLVEEHLMDQVHLGRITQYKTLVDAVMSGKEVPYQFRWLK